MNNEKTEGQTLSLLEPEGRAWPHGEREVRPDIRHRVPLSPAMRSLLESHHAETYEAGRRAGVEEMERRFSRNGLASLVVGALSGAVVVGLLWLAF